MILSPVDVGGGHGRRHPDRLVLVKVHTHLGEDTTSYFKVFLILVFAFTIAFKVHLEGQGPGAGSDVGGLGIRGVEPGTTNPAGSFM